MSPHPRSLLAAGLLLAAGSAFAEPGARDPFAPAPAGDPIRLAQAPGVMGHFLDGAEDERDQGGGDTGGDDDGNTGGDGGEVIGGGDGSGLTDWEDPTQLEYYKDYPAEEPRPDGMSQSLKAIAESMEPGEWRRLPVDAKYQATTAWSDKAMWDSERNRLSWLGAHGLPRPTRWVMWDVKNGLWYRQTGDEFHPYAGIHSEWGYRSYGYYTQLADGSNVYARFSRLWKQDPETLEWSVWAMIPQYQIIGGIEYFPEMGDEGSVIYLGATNTSSGGTRFMAYDVATGEWRTLPKPAVQGRHSLMRYNPARKEVLLLGGDQSYNTAQILNPDGTLTRMADSPRDMRIMLDQLCVDPASGHYLVMSSQDDAERPMYAEFFGFNATENKWYVINQWSDRKAQDTDTTIKHEWAACAAIPEFGVTIWPATARGSISLYKHDPSVQR